MSAHPIVGAADPTRGSLGTPSADGSTAAPSLPVASSAAAPDADGSAVTPRQTTAYSTPPPEPAALPPLPKDEESQHLVQRADQRWQALVKGDFARANALVLPSERPDTPETAGLGPFVKWLGAEVVRLEYDQPDQARVGVLVDHSFIAPTGGDTPIRSKAFAWERWVKEDGTWWHANEFAKIPGVQPENPAQPSSR